MNQNGAIYVQPEYGNNHLFNKEVRMYDLQHAFCDCCT